MIISSASPKGICATTLLWLLWACIINRLQATKRFASCVHHMGVWRILVQTQQFFSLLFHFCGQCNTPERLEGRSDDLIQLPSCALFSLCQKCFACRKCRSTISAACDNLRDPLFRHRP